MGLIKSKKFQAAIAGVIIAAAGEIGLDLHLDQVVALISPLLFYIGGQGLADIGKEKAKIEQK